MPPSAKKQNTLTRGISAFTYIKREDKSPLRPSEPILRTRWLRHLYEWLPKQDEQFPELLELGYVTYKNDVVFSTLEQATDYTKSRLPAKTTVKTPAPRTYVRDATVTAAYAASTGHVELTLC